MGQVVASSHENRPIDVPPDVLEKLATSLDLARVPIELAASKEGGSSSGPGRVGGGGGAGGGGGEGMTFMPLEARQLVTPNGSHPSQGAAVTLHVYDLDFYGVESATISKFSGVPIYHLGVEVYQLEFCFGIDGIVSLWPGTYDISRHRKAKHLGKTHLSNRQVLDVLNKLSLETEWDGAAYRLLGNNCQTFAVEFCRRLGLSEDCIPEEYMRFADGLSLLAKKKSTEFKGPKGSAVQLAAHQKGKGIAKIRL